MGYLPYLALLVLAAGAECEDGAQDTCGVQEGPWGALLEQWALSAPAHTERHGRIMALPPAQGYYVTDRVDRPPPPPRYHPHGPPHHMQPQEGPHHHTASQDRPHHHTASQEGPQHHIPPPDGPHHHTPPADGPRPYDEWHPSPAPPPPPGRDGDGKIVNRPTKPYNDQYKPSYQQSPPASQQIPTHQLPAPRPPPPPPPSGPHRGPGPVDRVDEPPPPRKQVSETDLYLLSAIEKLVYRVDLMEKRLRKMEENMHYLVAGPEKKPEPCVANFTRLGSACYHVSEAATDWKSANLQCRKLRANLLELETEGERRQLQAAMLADKRLRGTDVWTGGLNPGLLWIWSHSARPVAGNATHNTTATIVGEGRCLALVHDPAYNTYVYRGQDCALRHRYICEKEEDKTRLSNEIERVARALKHAHARKSKDLWGGTSRDSDTDTTDT